MQRFKKLDYELLQVLLALNEHRSCQKAAQSLGMSGSAISRHLKLLREIFLDTLFIRRATGLVPTDKTAELIPIAKELCQQYQNLENSFSQYDPSTSQRHFTIVIYDDFSPVIHKIINTKIKPLAPHMTFDIRTLSHNYTKELEDGDIDIAIMAETFSGEHLDGTMFAEVEDLYLIGNRKHPLLNGQIPLDLEQLFKYTYYELDNYCEMPEPLVLSAAKARDKECDIAGYTDSLASLACILSDMDVYSFACNKFAIDYISLFPNLTSKKLPKTLTKTLLAELESPRPIGHYVVCSDLNKSQARNWLKEVLIKELAEEWNNTKL